MSFTASLAQAQVRNLFFNQNSCNAYQGLLKSNGFTSEWRFQETSGSTANDVFGNNQGTFYNSPGMGLDGPLLKPSNAVLFDGATQFMASNSQVANPTNFTILVWFKTTTTSGGKIIGMGNSQTGSSPGYDRQIYMTNGGNLLFGVYNGSTVTVSTSASYNDGNWHLAAATLDSSAGMSLIVDGGTPVTNANTSAQNFSGYWRVGFDNLNGWPSQPSSSYFQGAISEVAIATSTALSTIQINDLYKQGSHCSNYAAAAPTLFLSAAQSQYNGICSNAVTVSANTSSASAVTVNLSGSGLSFYSDSNCASAISSATIPANGTAAPSFYFMGTANGALTLTAAATGYISATQTETISNTPYLWIGGGGNVNWSTGANWRGGSAPGSSDVALFDGTCSSNCSPTIDSSISLGGVLMKSGYTGTITQGSGNSITIGSGNWTQQAGTFTGAAAAITVNGQLYLSGGTYTATSGTLTANQNWQVAGSPTFNANSGTLVLAGNSTYTVGSENYNNVTFAYGGTASLSGTMSVRGSLVGAATFCCGYGRLSGGTIKAYGNISTSTSSGLGADQSLTLIVAGSTNQTISGGGGSFGSLVIASTGGTVTLSGTISVAGNYTFTSATLNAGTSTLRFVLLASGETITVGTESYFNVIFDPGGNTTTTLVGTMNVAGDYVGLAGCCGIPIVNGGSILVSGNFGQDSYNWWVPFGTTNYSMVGTANATLYIPNNFDNSGSTFTINKPGATVTLNSGVSVNGGSQNTVFTAGTISMGSSNLTLHSLSLGAAATINRGSGTLTVGGSTVGACNPSGACAYGAGSIQ